MNLSDITTDQAAALMRAAFKQDVRYVRFQNYPSGTVLNGIDMDSNPVVFWLTCKGQMMAERKSEEYPDVPLLFNAVAVVDLLRAWGVKLENK